MRAIFLILILAVVALIVAGRDRVSSTSTRFAARQAPDFAATQNGVTAKGGQTPAFDVETGSVKVGTAKRRTDGQGAERSKVSPAGEIRPPADDQQRQRRCS